MYTASVLKKWPKLLVCLLLLWTAVDFALPIVVCNSEGNVLADVAGLTLLSASSSSSPRPANDQDSRFRYEDDCFCCCSHIVPAPHFDLVAVLISAPTDVNLSVSFPQATPQTLFHPPRS